MEIIPVKGCGVGGTPITFFLLVTLSTRVKACVKKALSVTGVLAVSECVSE